jgi:guanine nucleotide-binding protein subunit beta-2-like 1 protein
VTADVLNKDNKRETLLVSSSRDKSIIIWTLYPEAKKELIGEAKKSLVGHSHFVSDLALSSDCKHVISSSWDSDLRLWSLE